MIVVKVEVWPNGQVTRAHEIARGFITNMTPESEENCNYSAKLDYRGFPYKEIPASFETVTVENHNSNQGVFALLGKVFQRFISDI